jgi:hypothetical protein
VKAIKRWTRAARAVDGLADQCLDAGIALVEVDLDHVLRDPGCSRLPDLVGIDRAVRTAERAHAAGVDQIVRFVGARTGCLLPPSASRVDRTQCRSKRRGPKSMR